MEALRLQVTQEREDDKGRQKKEQGETPKENFANHNYECGDFPERGNKQPIPTSRKTLWSATRLYKMREFIC